MSVKIYPDVCILLTLDFQQPVLLRKCLQFVTGVQQSNIQCYQLSTVKKTRESIVNEINEAVGNALRGLWNHVCMSKGGGVPFIVEEAILTSEDEEGFRRLFREKRDKQKRELAKDEIQRQEVWAIEKFRNILMLRNEIPAMDFLAELSQRLSEVYVETKNNMLRTNEGLNLVDEKEINPSENEIDRVYNDLKKLGLDDREDSIHLAALSELRKKKKIAPLFATTDRALSDLGTEIYKRFGIAIEDALYAIATYHSLKE